MKKQEIKPITMKFKDVGSFEFASTIQKIGAKETSNKNACAISRVVKALDGGRKLIQDRFQTDIAEKFGKRGEDGKLIRPENEPNGYDLIDGKEKELGEAVEAFGENTFEITVNPLTPSVLADHKLSANDIRMLGDLFSEDEPPQGPGLPLNFRNA